jgi:hypothetical protein
LALAEQAEPELYRADQLRWLHRLEEEYGNLRIGLEWFYREAMEACAHFAASLAYFWWVKGNIGERSFWLGNLIGRCAVLSPAMRARILRESGIVALQQGDLNIAQATGVVPPLTNNWKSEVWHRILGSGRNNDVSKAMRGAMSLLEALRFWKSMETEGVQQRC